MKDEKFVDTEEYPVEMSAGGINAYYVNGCEVVGHRPGYCVCVNKIQHFLRKKSLKDSPCEAPIRGGSCNALRMRKEELAKGKAIYFVHREKLNAFNAERRSEQLTRIEPRKDVPMKFPQNVIDEINEGRARVGKPPMDESRPFADSGIPFAKHTERKPKSRPKDILESIDDSGYAKAINNAIKPLAPVEGESFLELARRTLASTTENEGVNQS